MTAKTTGINKARVQRVRDRLNPPSEATVRNRARQQGYVMRKSRRQYSNDNLGEFQLVDPARNCVVFGFRFDATPAEIADFLRGDDDE
jgi:hypothetical protein